MTMSTDTTHRSWLAVAYQWAVLSNDPSTQNGVVLLTGRDRILAINEPTPGIAMTPTLWCTAIKYRYVEHAERNTIYEAARRGVPTEGATMYAAWAACADCARAIVQAGIATLVRHKRPGGRWSESIHFGDQILQAGGVQIIDIEGPIPGAPPVRFDGQLWDPSKETQ